MTRYFAFGSNMDFAQMVARCPSTTVICVAEFRDYALDFPRFSPKRQCAVAACRSEPGQSVWGVVYEVSDADLAHLDTFEGFRPDRHPSENGYNRVDVEVNCNGAMLRCMTYEAQRDQQSVGLTSRHYLGQLITGARFHGLPADYISFLEAIPTLPE